MNRYEAKERYVERLMRENAEIETLTPEQHDALESVARMRHELHANAEKMFFTSHAEYSLFKYLPSEIDEGIINNILVEAGLAPIKFINLLEIPCDLDYLEFMPQEECEEWERKAEEVNKNMPKCALEHTGFSYWIEKSGAYEEFFSAMASVNSAIEHYLYEIDQEHGTRYCPSGYARLY